MFYETARRDHGLPYDPFKAIVAPRPIGWISSVSAAGEVNLAPYSYFNAISSRPDMVMFSSEGEKDSARNIRETGEFVCNYVSVDMGAVMNTTSVDAPPGVDEFELAGLGRVPSVLVRPPRVEGVVAALECRATLIERLVDVEGKSANRTLVVGQVLGVHIDDRVLKGGRFDFHAARPIMRMGYMDYLGPDGVFEMVRPKWNGDGSP